MTEAHLARLRPELERYCKRLVPAADAADLAQEALLVGLVHLRSGKVVGSWPAWLAGIARRLARRHGTDATFSLDDIAEPVVDRERLGDGPLAALLERERGALLEQAFGDLTPQNRRLLTARYLDERPVADLARELGIGENAASARLGRARDALLDTLASVAPEAAHAHGLIAASRAAGWTDSALYCPRCGRSRLKGRLTDDTLDLSCVACDRGGGGLPTLTTHAAPLAGAAVLGGARGFRVALRRVLTWWAGYLDEGLRRGMARCVACGRATPVHLSRLSDGQPGFTTRCACGESLHVHPAGLLLHSPDAQTFWRDHPRLRFAGQRRIVCQGQPARLVVFEDPATGHRIEGAYALSSLRRLA